MQIILNFIYKYGKKFLPYLIIIGLLIIIKIMYSNFKETKADLDRTYNNLSNSNFTIKEMTAKDKTLYYEINQLTLKKNEFEELVPKLNAEITNLKSKLKNISNITTINTSYNIKIDTIYIDTLKKIKTFNYIDSFIVFKGEVNYNQNTLNNVNLTVIDSLLILQEVKYKRYWIFWKKPIGTKIKIKSENPYLILKNVESYNFDF